MADIVFSRSLPVRYDVDVLVMGGGPAGCAAAIAAARQGAKVLLVEGQAALGGMGTTGMIPAFMTFGDGEHFLAAGLGREFLDRMWAIGGVTAGHGMSYSIRAEALKRAYDEMVSEAGVELLLMTRLTAVETKGGRIEYCVLASQRGMYAAKAKVYIDCTGDGSLAAWAGAPCEMGDENGTCMPATLCGLWSDIDFARRTIRDDSRIQEAYDDGVFEKLDLHFSGMWQIYDHVGGSNTGHAFDVDATDETSLTEALVYSRRLYAQIERYYHEYIPGFENARLVATAGLMGIRESRRIVGEYVLNMDDYLARRSFPDEIGRYCYNVDIHPSARNREAFEAFKRVFEGKRYKPGESYGVPFRVLLPKGVDNLLVAGRCISTDRPMQSSMRVMPGCYITGQAAGVAAGLCVKGGFPPHDADVSAVRRELAGMNMYLPDARE
ncbi:MAG: FAD-dependent oxidoreductase [Clostridia bacterium]|nr:FAD-dependent oxidoreductase [Clostridia bacterium]